MRSNKVSWILIGILLGVILGVEVVHLAGERVCPAPNCVDRAKVVPLSDRGYFPALHEALMGAQKSIHIASFELKYYKNFPRSSMNIIVEDLIAAHRRGVDVRIVVDEYSRENNAYEKLKEAGIDVRFDGNESTTHAKLIIVDGKIVFVGSSNLSYYGLEKNREADVMIEDEKTVEYYERYFKEIFEGGKGG